MVTQPVDRAHEMLEQSEIPEDGSERLLDCLTALERSVPDTVPQPGPELAALMAQTSKVVAAPFMHRHRRVLVAGVIAFGSVAAGGIAAAANELPPSAQTVVAEFSERFLPFDLPRPDVQRANRGEQDSPEPEPVPVDGTDQDYLLTREDEGADTAPGGAPTPTDGQPTSTPSSTTAPTAAPSPSALPTPGAIDPTTGTGLPDTPEGTTTPDSRTSEEPTSTDGSPQAAPEQDPTSAPTTGDSTGTEPAPTDSSASPSPGTTGPTLNSRRSEGMERRSAGKAHKPRKGEPGDGQDAG